MSEKENTVQEEVVPQGAPTEAPQAGPDLSVQDLQGLKTIIDVASSRGAFKPNEMTAVGQTYTKLTAFLDQVAKQAEGQKQNG